MGTLSKGKGVLQQILQGRPSSSRACTGLSRHCQWAPISTQHRMVHMLLLLLLLYGVHIFTLLTSLCVLTVAGHISAAPYLPCCRSLTENPGVFCDKIKADGLITCVVQVDDSFLPKTLHLQSCACCLHRVLLQPVVSAWLCTHSIKQRCPAEGGQDISHPVSIKLETLTRSMNGNLAQLHDRGRGRGGGGGPSDVPRHSQAPSLKPPSYLSHVSSGCF